jgi:hypothetical protein
VSRQGFELVLTRRTGSVHSKPADAAVWRHSSLPLNLSLHALLIRISYILFSFLLVENEMEVGEGV